MGDKYQPYIEYKDTDCRWIRKIPKHWMLTELKRYSSVQGGFAFSSDSFLDTGKAVIRIGDIKQDGSVSLESCKYIKEENSSQYGQYEVHNGALLMAMTGATIGKAGWYKEKESALLNQRVGSFKCNEKYLNYKFFWYVLNSTGYQEYITLTAFGGAQPNISDAGMVGYHSAFPPKREQEKIADFLDHETAKIDTLIEKQQQLIRLLKEKRQAVISHAVTKGLNPDAPMRDSGVEWLGEVPEHWEVSQLKYIVKPGTSITYGIVQAGPHIEEGIPYIKTSDMSGDRLPIEGYSKTSKTIDDSFQRSKVFTGDIVMAIRATVGKCLPVPKEISGANLTQGTAKISPGTEMEMRYLLAYLSSEQVQNYLNSKAKGATFKEITLDMLRRVAALIPPKEEQLLISDRVDMLGQRFKQLIDASEKQVKLLTERRTALISAAVTGKIDVRNWQAPKAGDREAAA
ncbi:restriction endonuclease subunit S [Microbulbifer sp. CnH-101-E]|uniref:restriction endonuclease subunit S n=1 Tax=unclassified Microbulbifer TaxID=2619833 RepID=UPI0040392FDA